MKLKQQNKIKESRRHNNFKIWAKIKEIRNKAYNRIYKAKSLFEINSINKMLSILIKIINNRDKTPRVLFSTFVLKK